MKYFVIKQEPEAMRVNGTTVWGEVWSLISSESGDIHGVDALYCGFFVDEATAMMVKERLEQTPMRLHLFGPVG